MAIYDGVLNTTAEAALVTSHELRTFGRPAPVGLAIDTTNSANLALDAFGRVSSISFEEHPLTQVVLVPVAEDDSEYW